MLALSQDLSQNRPAEAREHVRRFHELFFTLSPEKSAIEHNVKRALLLADKSAYNYYQDFAEKGFYNRLIAGNINQLREKIGVMFGNPETTTGGNALKFYASVRLDIRKATAIKDGDEVVGNLVRVKVVKNKVAPPFRKAEFDIMFGEGISRAGEVFGLAVANNIIEKSGSWYSYGGSKLGQGADACKALLKDNPELLDELEAKVREALAAKEQK